MKLSLIILTVAGLTETGFYRTPPCQCDLIAYKRKTSPLPCLVGILRDSASHKPLPMVGALLINNVVFRSDKEGKTYAEVISNREYILTAKVYFYYPCTRKLRIEEGDSIVCIFNMRKNRAPSDGPRDFIHK